MRLLAATCVAGSTALLHEKVLASDERATKHDLEIKEADASRQNEEMANAMKDIAKKADEQGLSHEGSMHKELGKLWKGFQDSRSKAIVKSGKMTHDEALDTLKNKMSDSQRKQISLLMEKGTTKVSADEDKGMYIKAVQALNKMFLGIEDERTKLVMTCHNEIFQMYTRAKNLRDNINYVAGLHNEAYGEFKKAAIAWYQAWDDEWKTNEFLRQLKQDQAMELAPMLRELEAREADAALYRFIMNKMREKCSGGKSLLQTESKKEMDQKMQCSEHCASLGEKSVNKAILEVFADPQVMDQAQKDLDAHGQHSLKVTLQHIHEAELEEVHPKYSFLQLKKQPKDLPGWLHITGGVDAGCACGNFAGDCHGMQVVVGQQLECKKSLVRETEGEINVKKEEHKAAREDVNAELVTIDKQKQAAYELAINSLNKMGNLRPVYYQDVRKFWRQLHELWWYRFKCVTNLEDLDQNQFCAVHHVRTFMKNLAMEAFGFPQPVNPELAKGSKKSFLEMEAEEEKEPDLTDCELTKEFSPGECLDSDKNPAPCIDGPRIPSAEDLLPKMVWTRSVINPPDQSEGLTKALGGESIALGCPSTLQMTLPCNVFLCPTDCEVSEWSTWSSCTKDCDEGKQSRSRQIIVSPAHGGNKCEPTEEDRSCNVEACDKDCVLHDDFQLAGGCLEACLSNDRLREIGEAQKGGAPASGEVRNDVACSQGRCMIERKGIAEEAVGNGKCADFNHESRVGQVPCDSSQRGCVGDEVCSDTMDIVVAFECSIATGRLGCYYTASFVAHLVKRMPTVTFGFENMKMGLMMFGNGESVPNKDGKTFSVKGAHSLTGPFLTSDVSDMIPRIYGTVFGLWGKSSYRLGFNNMGQAIKQAGAMLGTGRQGPNAEPNAKSKLVMITRGVNVHCTVAASVAQDLKDAGTQVQIVLFADDKNDAAFDALDKVVSYPDSINVMYGGSPDALNDWGTRGKIASSLIPTICPQAVSPSRALHNMCEKSVRLIHRGRTCHNWKVQLGEGRMSLDECRNAAVENDYKSFIHTATAEDVPNCFTNEEDGKKDQIDDKGKALETTCTYVPDYGKEKEKAYKGWFNQELAAGNGDITNHYMVVESANLCPTVDAQVSPHASLETYIGKAFMFKPALGDLAEGYHDGTVERNS